MNAAELKRIKRHNTSTWWDAVLLPGIFFTETDDRKYVRVIGMLIAICMFPWTFIFAILTLIMAIVFTICLLVKMIGELIFNFWRDV